jgi:hypothetical protein
MEMLHIQVARSCSLLIVAGMGHSLEVGSTFIGMTDIATLNNTNGIFLHLPIEEKFEQMLINSTLSVISLDVSNETRAVKTNTWETIYVYSDPERLLLSYGIALLFATMAVALGCSSLYRNGEPGDRGFTQVLVATRNPELDSLVTSRQYQNTKIRYGRGMDDDKMIFGTDRTVWGR